MWRDATPVRPSHLRPTKTAPSDDWSSLFRLSAVEFRIVTLSFPSLLGSPLLVRPVTDDCRFRLYSPLKDVTVPALDHQRLLCILVLAAFSEAAIGDPRAEKPEHRVGDTWVFKMVESPGEQVSEWSRSVVEVLPPDRLSVRIENGELYPYTIAGTRIRPRGTEYSRELMRFPVYVGDRWTFARKIPEGSLEEKGTGAVVAYETLNVPAGTFECFRHDVEAWINRGVQSTVHIKWKRWYCPSIRWIAKEVIETEVGTSYGPATRTSSVSELVRFTSGP